MSKTMKTVFFTGGHHNSALEIAQVLRRRGYHIVWLGHKHTMRGETSLSFEYQEITKAEIDFVELKAGKFYRPSHFSEWLKLPLGLIQSMKLVRRIKPILIMAFGISCLS